MPKPRFTRPLRTHAVADRYQVREHRRSAHQQGGGVPEVALFQLLRDSAWSPC